MNLRLTLLLPALLAPLAAQEATPPVATSQRRAVVEALAQALQAQYVFPATGARVGSALQARLASGAYDGCTTARSFADALTKDLRDLGQDRHFRVRFDPAFDPRDEDEDRVPSPAEMAKRHAESARRGYGVARVERLAGNLGYLKVDGFGPAEAVGAAFSAAMRLLAGSDAVILDLRENGGGEPESVAYLVSHFLPEGDAREINTIYDRPKDATRQYWTSPLAAPRYGGPVYVLTSAHTFSGGEECAYDLQALKRATLVGETTGGGANPGHAVVLGGGFLAFIPTGRAINPVTKTNWEHVGVKPDVPVPAAEALRWVQRTLLRAQLAKAEGAARRELEAALAALGGGTEAAPGVR
jgi:hypothetical protein